jgi:hypothetical protein
MPGTKLVKPSTGRPVRHLHRLVGCEHHNASVAVVVVVVIVIAGVGQVRSPPKTLGQKPGQ